MDTGENSGASWLNYLVNAKQAANQRKFSFGNMVYEVTHIERQIDNVPGITDYLASSWLTFVLPLTQDLGNIGEIDIPIPLRAYPTPPSITAQASSYDSGSASAEKNDPKKKDDDNDQMNIKDTQEQSKSESSSEEENYEKDHVELSPPRRSNRPGKGQ